MTEYYDAYNTLSGSRSIGMAGVGPIPMSEILAYFQIMEIHDPDERKTYITMIQALDSVYLMRNSKKPDSETDHRPKYRKRR